jgi:N-acetyl-gamma-glutamyl-phosphate reductase
MQAKKESCMQCGIVGASGYTGGELMRLLFRATDVQVARVTANASAGKKVENVHPSLKGVCALTFEEFVPERFDGMDCVFIGLPSGEAMRVVPEIRGRVGKIIDLGGDFRLDDPAVYEKYYGKPHTAPALLGAAVYGLPELNRERIRTSTFVSNPGCYPTSAILGLLPALTAGLVKPEGIVITSMSGVSGAGRQSSADFSFTEVNESVRAYKVGRHQHTPEIRQVLESAAGIPVTLSFVPHLMPITRGIFTTIHADLQTAATTEDVLSLYEKHYAAEPFVRVRREMPEIKAVLYTNFCDITVVVEPATRKLIVLSVIDNLVKGAAGQALQNMNIMFGYPERHLLQ